VRALALDLGSDLGWALFDGHNYEFGLQDFHPDPKTEAVGKRLTRFRSWLKDMLIDSNNHILVDQVTYELPHHRGGAATRWLVGMATIVVTACADLDIPVDNVHTATLKKWTTGKGRAEKHEMIAAVFARWPKIVGDGERYVKPYLAEKKKRLPKDVVVLEDDEADAIALLMYTLEKHAA